MGQHRAVPALVGVALLVAAAGAGAAATDDAREPAARAEDVPPYLAYAPGDRPTRVPREYVLTNATLAAWLRRTASPAKNAIIFTTTWVAPGATDELEMISNFCAHLHSVGLLRHTLILTVDDGSWETLHARGLPVVLDRAFCVRQSFLDGSGTAYRDAWGTVDTPNRVFDVQKHWWLATLVHHGYNALYADADNVMLQSPLVAFAADWDLQALSDRGDAANGPIGASLHSSCGLYTQVKDERVALGSMLREWWRFEGGDSASALAVHEPCASTGLLFVKPTPASLLFTAAMRDRLLAPPTRHQWDQTAFNELVVPFLWGVADDPPLRFRLLPNSRYSNTGPYEARLADGLGVDPIVLHAGGVHGHDKAATFQRLGLWSPDFSLQPASVASAAAAPALAAARTTAARWLPAATLVLTLVAVGGAAALLLSSHRRPAVRCGPSTNGRAPV